MTQNHHPMGDSIITAKQMQSVPLVSIIIVTWNSKKYLPACLDRLSVQSFQEFEVILVDNGSDDDALDGLRDKYPSLEFHIHKLDGNIGFAAANNIGAGLARGLWLALLNADAFPALDWLSKLLEAAEKNPGFSSFSSRQINAGNTRFLDGAGDAYHISGFAWRRYIGYPADGYGKDSVEIFSPCAAAALYSREAFLKVGGFDNDLFSYYEDVDLGFRLRLAGYRAFYVADAVVEHVGSGTFGVRSDFAFYYSHRNLVWIFFANMPGLYLWLYLPLHIFTNFAYLLYYTLLGRGGVVWRAKRDALRGLSISLRKRREIQKNLRVRPTKLVKAMEHGWLKPFIREVQLRSALKEAAGQDS